MQMQFDKVTVIDGGFASQLSVHVGDRVDGDPLWSARFNATNKDAVLQSHMDYLKAGAKIIRTNTYQTSVDGYQKYLNLNRTEAIALIKDTVKLAHIARETYMKENEDADAASPIWIFGSIGPYGACLHDGSEYTGSYAETESVESIKQWHRSRIEAVIEAGVDGLAIETIPCLMEAEAISELMCDEFPNFKFWISFQCKDGINVAHGEKFADAALRLRDYMTRRQLAHNLLAIGMNCVHPQFVTPLLQSVNGNLTKDKQMPLVVYPNSGEDFDVVTGWSGQEDSNPLENYVPEWLGLGVTFIGSCCRTYAYNIARINIAVEKYLEK